MWTAKLYRRIAAIALGVLMSVMITSKFSAIAQDSAPSGNTAGESEEVTDSDPNPESTESDSEPAQSPLPDGLGVDLPPELSQFFASQETERIERFPVRLDGRTLLHVSAIAEAEGLLNGTSPVEERAIEVRKRLRHVATQAYDTKNLDVSWSWLNGYPLISAFRIDGDESVLLGEILTVTTIDTHQSWIAVDISSREVLNNRMADVADQWTQDIREGLLQFNYERSPSYLIPHMQIACGMIIGIMTLSYSLSRPQKHLKKKHRRFSEEVKETEDQLSSTVEQTRPTGVDTSLLVEQRIKQRQRQDFNRLNRRILQLGQIAVWSSGLFVVLGLFPYTRWLQSFLLRSLQIPGKLTVVVIVVYLATRFSAILIDRSFVLLQHSPQFLVKNSTRRVLRFSTFSSVTKSVVALLLMVVGFFIALHIIGVNVAPLIAGAGLLGFAVSFAAQNLIRDLINGFLILMEDQYGVGDVVIIGEVAGFVESMGLRITQLRNEEGRLITIPNGAIAVVQNLTKEWSRVDLMIDIAHTSDIDKAIAVIKEVAEKMAAETPWCDLILEAPLMLGVDRLDHIGSTVRIWIKTKPIKQWDVAREYRRRLKVAFDQNGIEIGMPQQAIRFSTSLDLHRNPNGGRPSSAQNGIHDGIHVGSPEDAHLSLASEPISGPSPVTE
ncbi:MAG: mechanosensitive ion channel family protein [Elainellaceae cyanobacterium]